MISIVVGAAIVAAGVFAVMMMSRFRPEAEVVEKPKFLQTVEVMTVNPEDLTVQLPTQGLVEPARRTTLASEVAGRVVEVAARFDVGEVFAKGEMLVRLEAADYQAALTQAEAALVEARAALETERARAEQALRDWKKLGDKGEPSDLALRKPQLESAEARVKAAEGTVEKSRRDLERTTLSVPFDGMLRRVMTEVGSFLAPGSPVAELDSIGTHEVRLPVSIDDWVFLPEDFGKAGTEVKLTATAGSETRQWTGRVVRSEGQVDRGSRTVQLVAEVEAEKDGMKLLQPGLFVSAEVRGRALKGVFRVPRAAFLDADTLLLVSESGELHFQKVKIVRGDGTDLLVGAGLKAGDQVCLTMLTAPLEGMEVRVEKPQSQDAAVPVAP
ncbi:MAG: efflux RND transporter periplasmic adaptor subunit [Verrucomicrobiales bacterium]|nr:efflux RND transporter periplasmic adaptor subunit [Verrucomicrobiales bacterium]